MTPGNPNICPECGNPIPDASQHHVCPACLLRQALASQTIAGPGEKSASPYPPPSPEEIADKFPQFEVTECLGRGGMGVVYKARQKSLNRWVAIKILAPERVGQEKFAERFAREARTLALLNHPNIVTVFDYGETSGLYYFVMEFVDGVNLRDLLRDGKLEPKQALAIVPPICEALQYAHEKGIVHRDIKPENLLLDREGRVKIADFGIAALVGAEGESAGTPQYMAPEQSGDHPEVDHRADIYALGVVLYEMLTGERPGKDVVAPSRKVQIDVRLDEIVLRALEKKPELRYQQASVLKTQVETIASTLPVNRGGEETQTAGDRQHMEGAQRFSRTALCGAAWLTFFFAVMPAFLRHEVKTHEFENAGPFASPLMAFVFFAFVLPAFSAPFGATTLGWIAITQIRRSGGEIYGLGFALFAGLLFPLLALDAAIAIFIFNVGIALYDWSRSYDDAHISQLIVLTCMFSAFADAFIIRRVWRTVNKDDAGVSPGRFGRAQKPGAYKLKLGAGMALAIGCGVLMVGLHSVFRYSGLADRSTRQYPLFGPVMENRVNLSPDAQSSFRFDTGGFVAPPADPGILEDAGKRWKWNTENGVDLFVRRDGGRPKLAFSDMVMRDVNEASMDSFISSVQLAEWNKSLDQRSSANETSLGPRAGKPTLFFRTRYDVTGLLQITGVTSDPPGVTFRYRLLAQGKRAAGKLPAQQVQNGASESATLRTASLAMLREPPVLRFLAWQDQNIRQAPPWHAVHPDGSAVTDPRELKLVQKCQPPGIDVTGDKPPLPRFLQMWFSHPLFNQTSNAEVAFLDHQGHQLPAVGRGEFASGVHDSGPEVDDLGWIGCGMSPGFENKTPPRVTVRLRYTIGPLENTHEVNVKPGTGTSMTLEGESQLNSIGQNVDGKAFLSISVNNQGMNSRAFGVVAVLKDGRELAWSGCNSTGGVGSAFGVQEFRFDAPLADVAKFRIGTRPIRTQEYKDVVLPGPNGTPVGGATAVFGLQAERTITRADANADGVVAFRFKDNDMVRPPVAFRQYFEDPVMRGLTPELKQWMRASNVDFLFRLGDKSFDVMSLDMRDGPAGQRTEWAAVLPGQLFPLLAAQEALNSKQQGITDITSGCGYADGLGDVRVFRTRDGMMGYYQLRGFEDLTGSGVEVRFKQIMWQATNSQPERSQGLPATYGPVIDLTVGTAATQDNMVDLDVGRICYGPSPLIQDGNEAALQEKEAVTFRSRGVDLLGTGTTLIGIDLATVQVDSSAWDTVSPDSARSIISTAKPQSIARLPVKTPRQMPETYVFKTGRGHVGLLQLTDLQEGPQRIRIRCKLVQAGYDANPWGEPTNGLQARLWTTRQTWPAGSVPQFNVDLRNQGREVYGITQAPLCAVELDGQEYHWEGDIGLKSLAFPPSREWDALPVSLGKGWMREDKPLSLSVGQHTLRLAFYPHGPGSNGVDPGRVVSNPVDFGVVSATTDLSPSAPSVAAASVAPEPGLIFGSATASISEAICGTGALPVTIMPANAGGTGPVTFAVGVPAAIQRLASGATVELVGVGMNPSRGQPWWRLGGSLLPQAPYEKLGASVTADSQHMAREIAVRLGNLPSADVDNEWSFSPSASFAGGGPPWTDGPSPLRAVAVQFPANLDACAVRFGLACGPWMKVEECGPKGGSSGSTQDFSYSFSPPLESVEGVGISIAENIPAQDVRVVAIGEAGNVITATRSTWGGTSQLKQCTATFAGLHLSQLKAFELQSRPYEWAEFRDVPLSPVPRQEPKSKGAQLSGTNQAAVSAAFGPVIEPMMTRECNAIAFASGTLGKLPRRTSGEEDTATEAGLMENNHWDALYTGNELDGYGMTIKQLPAEKWDMLAPDAVSIELDTINQKDQPVVRMIPGNDNSPAYAFETRDGNMGILQIVGFFQDAQEGENIRISSTKRRTSS